MAAKVRTRNVSAHSQMLNNSTVRSKLNHQQTLSSSSTRKQTDSEDTSTLWLGCCGVPNYYMAVKRSESKHTGGSQSILWSIIWMLLLLFVCWPLAFFSGFWYLLMLPFGACIPALTDVINLMEEVIVLPRACGEGFVSGKSILDLPICKSQQMYSRYTT